MGKAEVQIPLSVFFSEDQRGTGRGLAPFPCKSPISASLDPWSSKGKGWAVMNLVWRWRCAELVVSTSEDVSVPRLSPPSSLQAALLRQLKLV